MRYPSNFIVAAEHVNENNVKNERYMDTGNGKAERQKWTAAVDSYVEKNGVKIPSKMKAVRNLPSGDYEYFNGTITDIVYNCKQAR